MHAESITLVTFGVLKPRLNIRIKKNTFMAKETCKTVHTLQIVIKKDQIICLSFVVTTKANNKYAEIPFLDCSFNIIFVCYLVYSGTV